MVTARQREFQSGAGASTLGGLTCHVCGFASENRKLFKRDGDRHVCSTGHFEDEDGQPRRVKNPYAR
jgi:hypothetical protein